MSSFKTNLTFKSANCFIESISVGRKKMVVAKKVYKWGKRSIKGFLSFSLFYQMLTSILPWINKFIPIIKKCRKKLKCLIFRFWCNYKIRLFYSTELYYITLLSLQQKNSESLSAILFTETTNWPKINSFLFLWFFSKSSGYAEIENTNFWRGIT